MNENNDKLLVINTLKSLFEDEISNKTTFSETEILITLADGTNAKIRTENLA